MSASSSAPKNEAAEPPTVSDLIDAYMAAYAGRDGPRFHRLIEWKRHLGPQLAASITDDDVFFALERVAAEPARIYLGEGVDVQPVYRAQRARYRG